MGEGMLMKRGILTLDFWKDTITYQKRIMPTGSLACAALNISDDAILSVQNLINSRPRKCLGWLSPAEFFASSLLFPSVALA